MATAGNGQFVFEILTDKGAFDRPDLLNFNPWQGQQTDGFQTESDYTFSSMGNTYTTTFVYYGDFTHQCFNDPDDKKMLIDNVLCIRAGHAKPDVGDISYLEYISYEGYEYLGYGVYDIIYNAAVAEFGSEVYVEGYFRVMTDAGGEVSGSYFAEIPDKLRRTKKKIKFTQSAWVDVEADVRELVGENLNFVGGFDGWFQGCELVASAKGTAFEDGKSDSGMFPIVKPGTLDKGKSKLNCDKDATSLMTTKVGSEAAAIWTAALKKLGSNTKLKIKVNKKGLEDVSELGNDN